MRLIPKLQKITMTILLSDMAKWKNKDAADKVVANDELILLRNF